MEKKSKVYHKKFGSHIFTVVSPASSNGYKEMICESMHCIDGAFWIVTDKPENFYPAE